MPRGEKTKKNRRLLRERKSTLRGRIKININTRGEDMQDTLPIVLGASVYTLYTLAPIRPPRNRDGSTRVNYTKESTAV